MSQFQGDPKLITPEQANERLAIFGLINMLTGSELILTNQFEQGLRINVELLRSVNSLKQFLDSFHKSKDLNMQNCLAALDLQDKTPQYRFSTNNSLIVQVTNHEDYHTFSTSLEYDEEGNITRINISYFSGKESVSIIPVYDENNTCLRIRFEIFRSEPSFSTLIEVPTANLNEIFNYIFPPKDEEALTRAFLELQSQKIQTSTDPEFFESGIVYDNWEELREALIIFGEGNAKNRDELSGLDLEGQAWLDHGIENPFSAGLFGRKEYREDVGEWVDRNFKDNPEGERSFDYQDFKLMPNNFHKCQVEIQYMPDGKYILRIRQGRNGDMPEIQLAKATLQERVVNNLSQDFSFPSNKVFFYMGGIEEIERRLSEAGYHVYGSSYWALVNERRELESFYNKDRDSLSYDYVDESRFVLECETDKFKITLNIYLPRSSRVGGQILINEKGEKHVDPYDLWRVNPDEGYIVGRIARGFLGNQKLPSLRVTLSPKNLKEPGDDDKEEMIEVLTSIRSLIQAN